MFKIEDAIAKANAEYFRSIVRTEHEHLLRENHSFYCAYGHDWRQEKRLADNDPNAGLIEE